MLVTSRRPMTGLEDVDRLALSEMAQDEAVDLLRRILGEERADAEAAAVARVAELYGLSYTSFAHGSLEAAYNTVAKTVTLSVTVTNGGTRQGADVVQVYATLPAAVTAEPRRLVAFRKVALAPGASQRITFTVPADDLTIWSAGAWKLVPGFYTFVVARDSRTVTAQWAVTVN
ncbi:fibronectin type III-like domain-contianing protein [Streptomyces omiyaensis]|uniref:fibronectin type III-like domain-contianing protein n=1 Tax=Streptomyces omiyaensis TaxID=68247 RepID=UPI00370242C9